MESIRKWFYRPKKDDKSLLAQFFYADESLNIIANELDSFDGRKDPERCTTLVNQLRQSQDKVLTITNAIMDVLIGDERANRDFRVKFPEDVLQENLAGQLWFGAECLAAGSSIMNRETESIAMRPLAKAVTKSLEHVRNLLREACLRNNTPNGPLKLDNNELVTEMLIESLKIFDKFFAEFELVYVSAMVPVKTTHEYELQEMIGVLFSETLQRALLMKLLTQDMVDYYDPALMFTIPRLAIVNGLIFANGPLYIDRPVEEMSEMFRPFRTLLHKIRELLWTLTKRELYLLEKLLCDNEDSNDLKSNLSDIKVFNPELFYDQFYTRMCTCKGNCAPTPHKMTKRKTSVKNCNVSNYPTSGSPSTSSGYLIPNAIAHDTIAAMSDPPTNIVGHIESPPDRDSLEIISVAAATLTSILNTGNKSDVDAKDFESPDDSGISTENTSLDRSPTLDLNETKSCSKCCSRLQSQNGYSNKLKPSAGPSNKQIMLSIRKRNACCHQNQTQPLVDDDDSSDPSSSDTSEFNSISGDDEEIAMAMQFVEVAAINEVRSKYRSSEDLLHRLFVCIAGVADQLQTNFASDLRNILKAVFLINASDSNPPDAVSTTLTTSTTTMETSITNSMDSSIEYHPSENDVIENNEFSVDPNILAQEALFDTNVYFHLDEGNEDDVNGDFRCDFNNHPRQNEDSLTNGDNLSNDLQRYATIRDEFNTLQQNPAQTPTETESPPVWIPDVQAPKCMSCGANFTVVKRRHHCRNCGKVFCSRCSSNSVPLPKYGHNKPVRVCNKCFIYHLTPFTM